MDCGKYPVNLRIVRSDGQEWRLGAGTSWGILEDGIEDMNDMSYTVETSANVLTDGSSLVGKRVGEKDRTITAQYSGSDKAEERGRVLAFLNPKHTYKVHVTYMGRTRWYEGELLAGNVGTGNVNKPMVVEFTLLCLDPYLKDEDANDRSLTDAEPYFAFPFVSVIDDQDDKVLGFNASILIFDGKNTMINGGDVPCNYVVKMEFAGECVNPSFTKNGRTVKVLDTMKEGDILEIDFEASPPTVTKNGENIIRKVSRDSVFTGMELEVGTNEVSYAIENEENLSLVYVTVYHYEKYMGV